MPLHPHIVGRSETDQSITPTCINCHKPFKGGEKGAPGVNVYSREGMREIAISGLCEVCFDEVTAEPEDEDEGDFCPGCNPEPTISELENGRCASCGKEL